MYTYGGNTDCKQERNLRGLGSLQNPDHFQKQTAYDTSSLDCFTMKKIILISALAACLAKLCQGFAPTGAAIGRPSIGTALRMSEDFLQESPEGERTSQLLLLCIGTNDNITTDTKERIQALVDNHPVLLFMKGSKLFPQCGFSNTATQILMSYNIDFHTVDVLSDEAIRQGIKEFSDWPTMYV